MRPRPGSDVGMAGTGSSRPYDRLGKPSVTSVRPAGMAWRFRRMRAMSGAEVYHRVKIAVRDRWHPPPYAAWSADEAGRRLFAAPPDDTFASSRLRGLFTPALDRRQLEPELTMARALLAGRWTV